MPALCLLLSLQHSACGALQGLHSNSSSACQIAAILLQGEPILAAAYLNSVLALISTMPVLVVISRHSRLEHQQHSVRQH